MTREELVEKMWAAFTDAPTLSGKHSMAAALDVAVGELLGSLDDLERKVLWARFLEAEKSNSYNRDSLLFMVTYEFMASRRSRYLKPKSDPAVEAVTGVIVSDGFDLSVKISHKQAEQIVAAVRAADKEAHARL